MVKVKKSIVIKAPVETVFAYMGDARSNLEWLPGVMEITDIHDEPGQVGSHSRWAYKMAGLRFEGETTLVEYVKDRRMVTEGRGGDAANAVADPSTRPGPRRTPGWTSRWSHDCPNTRARQDRRTRHPRAERREASSPLERQGEDGIAGHHP